MLVPIEWLAEYVDFDLSNQELAERLTMTGTAVDAIETTPEGDVVLDLAIMPNRPDCLSILGVAREVAAITGGRLLAPCPRVMEKDKAASSVTSVEVLEPELCPRYIARVIENVKVGPSPEWLRKRLLAAGVRSINNIVDITNYVCLELNQPLHAFDFDKLAQNRIVVRRAAPGERIVTLDGEERELDPQTLVIADAKRPVAIAGVMGGENTEVTWGTKRVLLESANFDRVSIWKTSKRLKIRTEASVRFEKGLDPNNAEYGVDRAAQLIAELGAGEVLAGRVDIYPKKLFPWDIFLSPDRVNCLLGADIPREEMVSILSRLSMDVREEREGFLVKVPTFRADITREADLVEEIARIYGYEKIRSTRPAGFIPEREPNRVRTLSRMARETLSGMGLYEVITMSLVNPRTFDQLRLPQDSPLRKAVRVSNPLTEDMSVMRTTLLGSMIEVLKRNVSVRTDDVAVFELARVYRYDAGSDLPQERLMLSGALLGSLAPRTWAQAPRNVDFYDMKGILEGLLTRLGVRGFRFERGAHPAFHPGRTAEIWCGDTSLGFFGELHPELVEEYGFRRRPYLFELDFDSICEVAAPVARMEPLPKYPAVIRDVAVVLDRETPEREVESLIRKAGGELVKDVALFDVYEGPPVPPGKRSLAFSITYRASDRTLVEEEVASLHEAITRELREHLGAELRA